MEPLSNAMLELHRHSTWANAQLLDAAELLTPDQQLAPVGTGGFGNLLETLVHMFDAQNAYYAYLTERVNPPSPGPGDFPDVFTLRPVWSAMEDRFDVYLAQLNDAELTSQIPHPMWWSSSETMSAWEIVMHQLLHSHQHRGEIALVLTQLGRSPGELDYSDYLQRGGAEPSAP